MRRSMKEKYGKWLMAGMAAVCTLLSGTAVQAEEPGDLDIEGGSELDFSAEGTEVTETETIPLLAAPAGGKTAEFAYTGSVQKFTAPQTGLYTLEVWGAEGGNSRGAGGGGSADGGKGGYAKGTAELKKGDVLYIAVGGKGTDGLVSDETAAGGFNGGGDAKSLNVPATWTSGREGGGYIVMGAGGGATHIATADGTLSSLDGNRGSVLLAAGGGGGAAAYIWCHTGGAGGGETGGNGENAGGGVLTGGNGGTQTEGGTLRTAGSFGQGGSFQEELLGEPGAERMIPTGTGGGGGWFGGGGGYIYGNGGICGGGGSGYTGGVQNGVMKNGVQSGNGKALISWIPLTSLRIRYVDEKNGKELSPAYEASLAPGTAYETVSPQVDGYLLKKASQKKITGTLNKDTALDVMYTKLPAPVKRADREGPLSAGDELGYTITVENPTADERMFTVTDTIPEDTELLSEGGASAENGTLTWNLKIPGGGKQEVSFKVKVTGAGVIRNTAQLKAEHITLSSNEVCTGVFGRPDKRVQDTSGNDLNAGMVAGGDTLVYTVSAYNPAEQEASFELRDTLPPGTEVLEIGQNGVNENGTIVWKGTLPPMQETLFTVTVKASETSEGTMLRNTAVLKIGEKELESAPVTTAVFAKPQKSIRDTEGNDVNGKMVSPGTDLIYTIRMRNPGEEPAVFSVFDTVPEGLVITGISAEGSADGQNVSWQCSLEAGEEKELQISVRADEPGVYWNTAYVQIGSLSLETNPVSVTAGKSPFKQVLDENGSDAEGAVFYTAQNRTLTYCITVSNPAEETKHFTISDTLPQGLVFISADNNGFLEDRTVYWETDIPAASSVTVSLTAGLDDACAECDIVNTAHIDCEYCHADSPAARVHLAENPESTAVSGDIAWHDEDDYDKIRPETVTVKLLADGAEAGSVQVKKDSEGNMRFSFGTLPVYKNGVPVTYEVREDVPAGYEASITSQQRNFTIVNRHTPKKPSPTPSAAPQKPAEPTPSAAPQKPAEPQPSASPQAQKTVQVKTSARLPNTGDSFNVMKYIPLLLAGAGLLGYAVWTLLKDPA